MRYRLQAGGGDHEPDEPLVTFRQAADQRPGNRD